MKTLLLSAAAAAALLAATLGAGGASAAPAGFAPIAAPDTGVQQSRYMRRKRAMRRKMYRRGMGRMSAPSQAGNARNPSAPVGQQQQGQTTGGPRY